MNEIRDRVKELREDILHLTQAEFGNKLSLERSTISLMERKERNITERTVNDICREYGVNKEWLTEGVGDIFASDLDERALDFAKLNYDKESPLYGLINSILVTYSKLNDFERSVADKFINDIIQNNK